MLERSDGMSSTTATASGHVPLDDEPSLDPLDSGELKIRRREGFVESKRIRVG